MVTYRSQGTTHGDHDVQFWVGRWNLFASVHWASPLECFICLPFNSLNIYTSKTSVIPRAFNCFWKVYRWKGLVEG